MPSSLQMLGVWEPLAFDLLFLREGHQGWSGLLPAPHLPHRVTAGGFQVCSFGGSHVHPPLSAATAAGGLCAHLRGGEWKLRSREVKCLPHSTGLVGKLGPHPSLFPSRFQVPPPALGRRPGFQASGQSPPNNYLLNDRTSNRESPGGISTHPP